MFRKPMREDTYASGEKRLLGDVLIANEKQALLMSTCL